MFSRLKSFIPSAQTRSLIVIVFALGATGLAISDPQFRSRYSDLVSNAITGFFALAVPGKEDEQ